MSLSRREALKTFGALAGTAATSRLLEACGKTPGRIDTLVFLMMENRTYDHYLGSRALLEGRPGDGLTAGMSNLDQDGKRIPIFAETPEGMCVLDPPHGWDAGRVQLNGGRNDGFALAFQQEHRGSDGTAPMAYLRRADLPVFHALADAYTSCDRWFSAVLGPTLPNRMYWHAATANGCTDNESILAGGMHGVRTVFHALNDAGVDWAYYYGDVPVLALFDDLDARAHVLNFFPHFLDDAAAGKLPPVVYLDPSFTANDDHPPHHPLLGEQLINAAYHALSTSPHWPRCLFVITYDECGGFFDYVAPPTAPDERAAQGFDQLGFRVPALVIGPWVKQGHVSSVVRSHATALKLIEQQHQLSPLTLRDAAAADLSECLDAARLVAGTPAAPITLPAVEIDASKLPAECEAGTDIGGHKQHELVRWAQANPERLGALDRRRHTLDDLRGIAAWLEQRGLGRIR